MLKHNGVKQQLMRPIFARARPEPYALLFCHQAIAKQVGSSTERCHPPVRWNLKAGEDIYGSIQQSEALIQTPNSCFTDTHQEDSQTIEAHVHTFAALPLHALRLYQKETRLDMDVVQSGSRINCTSAPATTQGT